MTDETFLITPAGGIAIYPHREEAEHFLRGVRSREPFEAQLFDDVHELFEHVTGSENETVLEFLLVAACGTFPALDPKAAPHLSPYQYAVAKELRSLSQFGLIGYAQAFVVFNVLEQGSATPGAKAGNLVDFEGYHSGAVTSTCYCTGRTSALSQSTLISTTRSLPLSKTPTTRGIVSRRI